MNYIFKNSIIACFAIAALIILSVSCGDFSDKGGGDIDTGEGTKGADSGQEVTSYKLNIFGEIFDTDKTRLTNCTISSSGFSDETDSNGFFLLNDLTAKTSNKNISLKVSKDKYAPSYRVIEVTNDQTYGLDEEVEKFIIDNDINDISSEIKDTDGKIIIKFGQSSIPSNRDMPIHVNSAVGTDKLKTFPGTHVGYFSDSDNKDHFYLLSVKGYFYLDVKDKNSYPVEIFGDKATAKILLDDSYKASYKDSDKIDLFRYEPSLNEWVLKGESTIQEENGHLYASSDIDSTGWWAVAEKSEDSKEDTNQTKTLYVYIQEGSGNPMEGIRVYAESSDQEFVSDSTISKKIIMDDNSVAILAPVKYPVSKDIYLAVLAGETKFWYDKNNDGTRDLIKKDDYKDKQIFGPFTYNPSSVISGKVSTTDGTSLSGIKIVSSTGAITESASDGSYSIKIPSGLNSFDMFVKDRYFKSISSGTSTENITLSDLAPTIDYINFSPTDSPKTNEPVYIYAHASDPEKGSLSFQWSTDAGLLEKVEDKDGLSRYKWSSSTPETAKISLSVSDDKGNSASKSIYLSSIAENQSTNLKVTIKDFDTDEVIEGIRVINHIDKDSFSGMSTNSSGVADFGNTGKKSSTVSIIYNQDEKLVIETLDEVDTGEITYYIKKSTSSSCPETEKSLAINWNEDDEKLSTLKGIYIQPLSKDPIKVEDASKSYKFKTCSNYLQSDDTFSLYGQFILYQDYTLMPRLASYGYVKDADKNGDNFTMDITKKPLTSRWYNKNNENSVISASGIRKEKSFSLAANYDNPSSPVSGSIYFPSDDFMEKYEVSLFTDGSEPGKVVTKKINSPLLPSEISLEFPDMILPNLKYNLQSNSFTWDDSEGKTDPDYFTINILPQSGSDYNFHWKIYLKDSKKRWDRLKLPDDIEEKIPENFYQQTYSMSIAATSKYSGFDGVFKDMQKRIKPYDNTELLEVVNMIPDLSKDN